ncbi:MAG: FAD-dependent oxidoreductase [Tissierellia bacterium]|nr:FAD-dependent oxidoreductase [Tissierellia bacterium]
MGLSRRDFIKGAAASAVGISSIGFLASCAAGTSTADTSSNGNDLSNSEPEKIESWDIPPEPITDFKKTLDTEVLIVGAGNGGLFAACSAAENGAKVTVIERNAMIGTGRGWIGAIGSNLQKEAGIELDKFEIIEEACKYASHRVDQKLIKLWADNSGDMINWLEGIVKDQGAYVMAETDSGENKGYYKTFPIQHNVQNEEKSIYVTEILKTYAESLGVEILLETPMVQLIRENNEGRVTGAAAKTGEEYIKINASKGVILATGGYSANLDMLKTLNPLAYNSCTATDSHAGSQGDGIKAATWIGAAKDDVPTVMIFDRGGCPPDATTGGDLKQGMMTHIGSQPFLKVNKKGERFVNESIPYDFMIHAATLEPEDTYCMIWDSDWREHTRQFRTIGCSRIQYSPSGSKLMLFDEEATEGFHQEVLMPRGIVVEDETLEGLADKLGIPADNLVATVNRYNELCEKGYDEDFGKESYRMLPLTKPPYRAATIGGQLLCTLDGLRINTNLQVLDKSHNPIDGLYAIGNDSGGFFSNNYPELLVGIAAGRTDTFGYLAGQIVASL